MITKNVLLGSLSFATVLMVGSWSGAIAQVFDRYLSNQEIQTIENNFQRSILNSTGLGYYQDNRKSSEVSEINVCK